MRVTQFIGEEVHFHILNQNKKTAACRFGPFVWDWEAHRELTHKSCNHQLRNKENINTHTLNGHNGQKLTTEFCHPQTRNWENFVQSLPYVAFLTTFNCTCEFQLAQRNRKEELLRRHRVVSSLSKSKRNKSLFTQWRNESTMIILLFACIERKPDYFIVTK